MSMCLILLESQAKVTHDLYGTVKDSRKSCLKGEFKGELFIEPNPGTLKNGQLQNDMEST